MAGVGAATCSTLIAKVGAGRSSAVEYVFERQMGFHNRGLQHDKTEVFVDADIHFDKTFHDCLIFADSRCNKLHEVIVSARNKMAFDDGIDLFDGREKASEIDLAMIFERDFGKDGQGLSEFGNIDLGGITSDEALGLEPFDAHQAWARGKVDQLCELDVGNPPIFLQFA
jgi:hypothetical protein